MARYKVLLEKSATFDLFGVGKVYIPAGQIISDTEIPRTAIRAIQEMTHVRVFEEVKETESNILSEKDIEKTPEPPTLKQIAEEEDKEEERLEDLSLDDLRLKCEEMDIKYTPSNNKPQLIKKIQEAEESK